MKCPFCQSVESRVIDKRDTENIIRRRRECLKCNKRFTTHEEVEDRPLTVIKKDNTRRPFDRSKVLSGIMRACEKTTISVDEIEAMVDRIESKLRSKGVSEIESKQIGREVMKQLKRKDKVAYIRFASVYREFKDLDDFKDELEKL